MISVVEDDQPLRSALLQLIGSIGLDARGFASAEEFISAGAMLGTSCVVTDIQMPGMTGIELAHLIAECQPGLPVIMITGRPDRGLEESAQASGAACLLRKPIDTDLLVECLERVLKA